MTAISVTATTDTRVSVAMLKSRAVSSMQLVELLVDLSAETYAAADGVTFTGATLKAAIKAFRKDGRDVTIPYLATYSLMAFAPGQGSVDKATGIEYVLTPQTYDGTTLKCAIVKLADTTMSAMADGAVPTMSQPFGLIIAIADSADIPTS
jgi:hypothetical protein